MALPDPVGGDQPSIWARPDSKPSSELTWRSEVALFYLFHPKSPSAYCHLYLQSDPRLTFPRKEAMGFASLGNAIFSLEFNSSKLFNVHSLVMFQKMCYFCNLFSFSPSSSNTGNSLLLPSAPKSRVSQVWVLVLLLASSVNLGKTSDLVPHLKNWDNRTFSTGLVGRCNIIIHVIYLNEVYKNFKKWHL